MSTSEDTGQTLKAVRLCTEDAEHLRTAHAADIGYAVIARRLGDNDGSWAVVATMAIFEGAKAFAAALADMHSHQLAEVQVIQTKRRPAPMQAPKAVQ